MYIYIYIIRKILSGIIATKFQFSTYQDAALFPLLFCIVLNSLS